MRPGKNPKKEIDVVEEKIGFSFGNREMIGVTTSSQSRHPCRIFPKWFMLDSAVVVDEVSNCTKALSHTKAGVEFSISLKLAIPPALSYMHLNCEQAVTPPTEEHGGYGGSSVIAADGQFLLACIVVPVEDKYGYEYPNEFFVYSPNPLYPSLEPLPSMVNEWLQIISVLGIIRCSLKKSYMVVGFRNLLVDMDNSEGTQKELAQLGRFSSWDHKWDVKEIEFPYKSGLEPFEWEATFAFSYGNMMCFVDYNIGLMFCDVFNDSPKLQYVQFPVPVTKASFRFDNEEGVGGPVESWKTVGVCNGKIKFVNVDTCCTETTGPTIRTWMLHIPEMVWEEDSILDVNHLWATDFKVSRLPHWVPQFPVVNAEDPDILHFVLLGPNYHDRVWIITINMKTGN